MYKYGAALCVLLMTTASFADMVAFQKPTESQQNSDLIDIISSDQFKNKVDSRAKESQEKLAREAEKITPPPPANIQKDTSTGTSTFSPTENTLPSVEQNQRNAALPPPSLNPSPTLPENQTSPQQDQVYTGFQNNSNTNNTTNSAQPQSGWGIKY